MDKTKTISLKEDELKLIRNLMIQVTSLPYFQEDILKNYLRTAEGVIDNIYGPDNNYREVLKVIQFSPPTTNPTEDERKAYWRGGIKETRRLWNIILKDLGESVVTEPQTLHFEESDENDLKTYYEIKYPKEKHSSQSDELKKEWKKIKESFLPEPISSIDLRNANNFDIHDNQGIQIQQDNSQIEIKPNANDQKSEESPAPRNEIEIKEPSIQEEKPGAESSLSTETSSPIEKSSVLEDQESVSSPVNKMDSLIMSAFDKMQKIVITKKDWVMDKMRKKQQEETKETVEEIKKDGLEKSPEPPAQEITQKPVEQPAPQLNVEAVPSDFKPSVTNQIFVVHSDDEELKEMVTSTLNKISLEAILTQDRANALKPLAQKITEHQHISFAIVILSADDFVYSKNGKPVDALIRADQKVVFELGFWIGRLGRENVIALYQEKKNFRQPTKFFDAIYIPMDQEGAWKKELIHRLEQKGFKIHKPQ